MEADENVPTRKRQTSLVPKRMGALLATVLKQKGISQRRWAVVMNVTEGYVSKVLKAAQNTDPRVYEQWAKKLGYEFQIQLVEIGAGDVDAVVPRASWRRRPVRNR